MCKKCWRLSALKPHVILIEGRGAARSVMVIYPRVGVPTRDPPALISIGSTLHTHHCEHADLLKSEVCTFGDYSLYMRYARSFASVYSYFGVCVGRTHTVGFLLLLTVGCARPSTPSRSNSKCRGRRRCRSVSLCQAVPVRCFSGYKPLRARMRNMGHRQVCVWVCYSV